MADETIAIGDLVPLDQSITEAWKVFEQNDLETAMKLAEAKADKSLYHSQLKALLSIEKAGFTLAPADMTEAKTAVKKCLKLCTKIRGKKKLKNLLTKKQYSDMELHAEVMYAIISGMKALFGLLTCYSIQKLAKIAYTAGQSAKVLNKIREIISKRTTWESPLSKETVESAIRLENGLRQLIVSFLPPNLLKFVSFLGFKGVREVAFSELNAVAFELPGMYSMLGQYLLVVYWLIIEMHGCIGEQTKEFEALEANLKKKTEKFPNVTGTLKNFMYHLAMAKLTQIRGNSAAYVDAHLALLKTENPIFHVVSHWELVWQYALNFDLENAIKYCEMVRKVSQHSPPLVTFFEAQLRYQKGKIDGDAKQIDQASALLETIPSMKVHSLGNTMTPEKAVVKLSKRYFKTGKVLICPMYEQLYNLNFHLLFTKNQESAAKWMKVIEDELAQWSGNSEHRERYLVALFLKGTALKGMKNYDAAKEAFNVVIDEAKVFKKYKYMIPQAQMELGLIMLEQGARDEAKEQLNMTLKKYSDYISENQVHIKIYAALRALGVNTDKTEPIEGMENLEDMSNVASDDEEDDDED